MGNKNQDSNRELLLASGNAPFDFVEAYKSLRTNMEFLMGASNVKSIVITSTEPEEGKSNVAVNLGLTMADTGTKVVIVDGDLRKGTTGKYLNISHKRPGISNYVSGKCDIIQALVKISSKRPVYMLPTGPLPPNPAELLVSEKFAEMIEELKGLFDYIIIDAPPAAMMTDAVVLSRYVDGVVVVVRSDKIKRDGAQIMVKHLKDAGANILGCILNGYDARKSGGKGYYYSNYGYKYGYSYDTNRNTEQDD